MSGREEKRNRRKKREGGGKEEGRKEQVCSGRTQLPSPPLSLRPQATSDLTQGSSRHLLLGAREEN